MRAVGRRAPTAGARCGAPPPVTPPSNCRFSPVAPPSPSLSGGDRLQFYYRRRTCCVGLQRCWPIAWLVRGCSPALSPRY